jgi:hypothetical protein
MVATLSLSNAFEMSLAAGTVDRRGPSPHGRRVASKVLQALGLLLSLALLVCAGGCSRLGAHTSSAAKHGDLESRPAALPPDGYIESDGDADKDDEGNRRYSLSLTAVGDDLLSPSDGAKADQNDFRIIAARVKGYYVAAASERAGQVCAMFAPELAEGLAESPSQAGQAPSGCRGAVALLLKQQHGSFAADDVATMTVAVVQIKGDVATATVGFRTRPIGKIRLKRVGSVWWMNALIDTGLN